MRLVIRGCTGSGKSTLSSQVGAKLGIPSFDLDDFYHLPDWQQRPREEMRANVREALGAEAWALAGNYSYCDDLVLPRITHLVWLDYSRSFTFLRLLRRTARRVVTGEPCCNGNRELLGKSLSRNGILYWHITSYARMHERAERFFADPEYEAIVRHRFRRPAETEAWLRSLPGGQA
ncbi:toxin [bacterium]|nr:MAG: toxin [bacterium]